MADYKYLNETGLNTLWAKIKARVKILSSTDISTSVDANVGTIVVNDTTGAAWVVLTATNGKAATWRKLSNGDIEALKTSVSENADAINDIINSIGATSGYQIVKNSGTAFNADEIIAGTGNSKIKGSGMYFGSSVNPTSANAVPTSKAVADYVAQEITEAQQAAIKTYAIAVTGTFSSDEVNSQLAVQTADVLIVYATAKSIKTVDGTDILLSTLKVGDTIYVKETGYPDRWVSSQSAPTSSAAGSIVFSKLETQDLSIFVQKPDSTKTGDSNQTITSLGVDSNNKLTATWSNIALGNIDSSGSLTGSAGTIANTSTIVIAQNGKITKSGLTFNTGTSYSNYFLSQNGKWSQVDVSAWKSIFTAKGQLIYSTAASTVATLSAITPASGSQAMLTLTSGVPSWDTITPISDDTINALS